MKYEEIIKLLDAGYTREEIIEMRDAPVPEEQPQANNDPDMSAVFNEMRDMFAEMRKEFTAMNIMSSRQPAESEKTSEDIIANIINPEVKKKK